MDSSKINITDTNGNVIECDVLFTFDDRETKKSYVVYTDNTLDDLGNTKIFANIYDPNNSNGVLEKIDTDEEWALIEQLVDSIKK